MARKTLLTEGEIRKFMKLAQLAPLGQAKLTEYYSDEELSEQEEEEELAMDAPAEDELDMPAAEDEMEMDMDMGAEGEEAPVEDLPGEEEPAMRNKAYNRKDDEKEDKTPANRDDDDDETTNEELNLEVLDDEELTEAVLKRVVERLLRRK
jgi:hypothetical protein